MFLDASFSKDHSMPLTLVQLHLFLREKLVCNVLTDRTHMQGQRYHFLVWFLDVRLWRKLITVDTWRYTTTRGLWPCFFVLGALTPTHHHQTPPGSELDRQDHGRFPFNKITGSNFRSFLNFRWSNGTVLTQNSRLRALPHWACWVKLGCV